MSDHVNRLEEFILPREYALEDLIVMSILQRELKNVLRDQSALEARLLRDDA